MTAPVPLPYGSVCVVKTEKDLSTLRRRLKQISALPDQIDRAIAVDTETYASGDAKKKLRQEALILNKARIMFISMAHKEESWAIPLNTFYPGYLEPQQVFSMLKPFMESKSLRKVCHNFNYDCNAFMNHGVKLKNGYCTLIASHCWDETLPHSLKERCLFVDMKLKKTSTVDMTDIHQAIVYAVNDAVATWRLYEGYERGKNLEYHGNKRNLLLKGKRRKFFDFEMRLLPLIVRMERRGMYLDCEKLAKIDDKIVARMEEIRKHVYRLNEEPFNIASSQQLGEFLYKRLGLEAKYVTPTGKNSVDKFALADLRSHHPVVPKIVEYNQLQALRHFTSSETGLSNYADEVDHRIHSTLSQVGARTSRFSCSNINLQQIPSKTDTFGIRSCFKVAPGNMLIVVDMDQIELRFMAIFSRDPMMLKAYKTGLSIHLQTGVRCGLLPAKAVSKNLSPEEKDKIKKMRGYYISKNINFGLIYEGTKATLYRQLILEGVHTTEDECQDLIDKYYAIYQNVKWYRLFLYDMCRKNNGTIYNISGRPLKIENISSQVFGLRKRAERMAINSQIQSSAAEVIKQHMIDCCADKQLKEMRCKLLMQVHDELIFECPEKHTITAMRIVKEIMERDPWTPIVPLPIKLTASISCGPDWASAKG